jgi:hypothetical protein
LLQQLIGDKRQVLGLFNPQVPADHGLRPESTSLSGAPTGLALMERFS